MKVTFAMIVFNSDFVLKQVIDSVLPHAHAVIISEGPVKYYADKGLTTSEDRTNNILDAYDKDITVLHGTYNEKTEQCQAFMAHIPDDTEYLWVIDADEIFKPNDIQVIFKVLQYEQPGDISFTSNTFFGGFDYIIGGFERKHNFKRIMRYHPEQTYSSHRPPTLSPVQSGRSIPGSEMLDRFDIEMYHYSYVSPFQVKAKIEYYEHSIIKKGNCIDDYFNKVWFEWVTGGKEAVETIYCGVHEFKPAVRNTAYTEKFEGRHPPVIEATINELKTEINWQLRKCYDNK